MGLPTEDEISEASTGEEVRPPIPGTHRLAYASLLNNLCVEVTRGLYYFMYEGQPLYNVCDQCYEILPVGQKQLLTRADWSHATTTYKQMGAALTCRGCRRKVIEITEASDCVICNINLRGLSYEDYALLREGEALVNAL